MTKEFQMTNDETRKKPLSRNPKSPGQRLLFRPSDFCLLSSFVIIFVSLAATPSAHAGDSDPLFERWYSAQTNLQSWSADFTQTRSLKILSQPLVGTGKVWVTSSRFRWEMG